MKKIIRLTENDLTRIVRRVIKESKDWATHSLDGYPEELKPYARERQQAELKRREEMRPSDYDKSTYIKKYEEIRSRLDDVIDQIRSIDDVPSKFEGPLYDELVDLTKQAKLIRKYLDKDYGNKKKFKHGL